MLAPADAVNLDMIRLQSVSFCHRVAAVASSVGSYWLYWKRCRTRHRRRVPPYILRYYPHPQPCPLLLPPPSGHWTSAQRAEGQRLHDLRVHLVNQLDRLTDSVVPRLHLPSRISCLLPLLQGWVVPNVEDGVQSTDLGEPSSDGFSVPPASLETFAPVLLPFQ